jgi:hypothetical protein
MIHHAPKSIVEIWGEKRVLGHYLGKFANEMVKWCFGLFYCFLPLFIAKLNYFYILSMP